MPDNVTFNGQGITNMQLVKFMELPADIVDKLQTAQGSEYTAVANEFLDALFNKVVYQTVADATFNNPFKKYDGFPVNFGDTIENIFVEMPKGYKFNPNATNPFAKAKPTVKALYATLNYDLQYKSTIEDSLLRRACLTEYGFMQIIDTILGNLQKSMALDEYFAELTMFNNADIYANGFETLEVDADASIRAKQVTEKIVDVVSDYKLPKSVNNKLGVLNPSRDGDILLVIKKEVYNSINLDYLTGVFNLTKVDLIKNIIVVDGFQTIMKEVTNEDNTTTYELAVEGEDLDFIIIDTRGMDNHVALQDGGLIYNPEGKYTNHYYNLWKIVSFKQFYNARAFKLHVAEEETEGE